MTALHCDDLTGLSWPHLIGMTFLDLDDCTALWWLHWIEMSTLHCDDLTGLRWLHCSVMTLFHSDDLIYSDEISAMRWPHSIVLVPLQCSNCTRKILLAFLNADFDDFSHNYYVHNYIRHHHIPSSSPPSNWHDTLIIQISQSRSKSGLPPCTNMTLSLCR